MPSDKKIYHGSDFLDRVEKAVAASGMSRTEFGYTYFGDPGAVKRLEKNGRLYQPTVNKIENVLATFTV